MWQKEGVAISYITVPLDLDQLNETQEPRINHAGSVNHHDAFAKVFEIGQWHSVQGYATSPMMAAATPDQRV
jgi:hypothetical protein